VCCPPGLVCCGGCRGNQFAKCPALPKGEYMNIESMPGFTAEASLNKSVTPYRSGFRAGTDTEANVTPQLRPSWPRLCVCVTHEGGTGDFCFCDESPINDPFGGIPSGGVLSGGVISGGVISGGGPSGGGPSGGDFSHQTATCRAHCITKFSKNPDLLKGCFGECP
jgi:hypothetical protein